MAEAIDIKDLRARFEHIKAARTPYEKEWRDLRDYIEPDCGRFETTSLQYAARDDRWEKIIDPCATDAADALAAGMLGGMTSPARPWFQLTTMNADLDESYDVKAWLSEVTEVLQMIFAQADVYQALHQAYLELAVFGTACIVALPSGSSVIHLEPLTVGEYWIATDDEGKVSTMYHQYSMTAEQMIRHFGRDAVSQDVRDCFDNNKRQQRFAVIQAIEPREDRDPEKIDQLNMPWRSVHFQYSTKDAVDKPLLVEGFTHFPALCPRWLVKAGAVYGTGVGAKALPLVKTLQGQQVDASYGIGYMARPPVQMPAALEGQEHDLRPGGIVYVARVGQDNMIQPAMNVNFNLQHLDLVMQRGEKKIESMFFKDLFLMLSNSARDTRTAYEVEQLQQEKMLMLGPVLERVHGELLSPLISAAYDDAEEAGKIPPPPESVVGAGLSVNYISVLALAQKASALNGYTNFMQMVSAIAQAFPDANAGDLLDVDAFLRRLADMLGIDPKLLRNEEVIAQIRDSRSQAIEQQAQVNQLQQIAGAGKDLSAVGQSSPLAALQGY